MDEQLIKQVVQYLQDNGVCVSAVEEDDEHVYLDDHDRGRSLTPEQVVKYVATPDKTVYWAWHYGVDVKSYLRWCDWDGTCTHTFSTGRRCGQDVKADREYGEPTGFVQGRTDRCERHQWPGAKGQILESPK